MKLLRGRPTAGEFEELIRPHMGHLYRLAYRFTDSEADAEDLVHDVLVKLYPRRKELKKIDSLRPWLSRVLYRQFIDEFRRKKASPIRLAEDLSKSVDGFDLVQLTPSSEPGPEEETANTLNIKRVMKALVSLPEEQRVLLLLRAEGYTLSELSEQLDCPLGTLKSRLHRARNSLRAVLNM